MNIQDRLNRVAGTSHIVYVNDMSVHVVHSIDLSGDLIFVTATDGMVFQDTDVFTLEEASNMERQVLKLYKDKGIKY